MSESSKATLNLLRNELKAPKSQYNSYGKYKYRSLEDIQQAIKPLLVKFGGQLVLTDEIKLIGDRYYIEATATFTDNDGSKVTSKAYAREPANKKGMDESQITGTASSYARKYALNALFLLDDTKDADTDAYQQQGQRTQYQQGQWQGNGQRQNYNNRNYNSNRNYNYGGNQ